MRDKPLYVFKTKKHRREQICFREHRVYGCGGGDIKNPTFKFISFLSIKTCVIYLKEQTRNLCKLVRRLKKTVALTGTAAMVFRIRISDCWQAVTSCCWPNLLKFSVVLLRPIENSDVVAKSKLHCMLLMQHVRIALKIFHPCSALQTLSEVRNDVGSQHTNFTPAAQLLSPST
jgi:hypothetical protein